MAPMGAYTCAEEAGVTSDFIRAGREPIEGQIGQPARS